MIPVRLYQERPQSTISGLNAPDGAGRFPTSWQVPRRPAGRVSMHLVVLGASRRCHRHYDNHRLYSLNAPDGAGCFPTPRRVVRCPAWGNGARVATGPRAPLGPGRAPLIEPGFAQVSQGSPPTGLPGLRATRCRRGHADPGFVPCSSDTSAQARAMSRQALARRPSAAGRAEAGVVPGLGAPVIPRRRGDDGPAAGVLVAGVVGVACLARPLQAGQGGEHGDRVVDEASAGPGH